MPQLISPRVVRTIEKCAAHGPGWFAVVAVATAGLLTLSALTSQDGLQQTGGGNGLVNAAASPRSSIATP